MQSGMKSLNPSIQRSIYAILLIVLSLSSAYLIVGNRAQFEALPILSQALIVSSICAIGYFLVWKDRQEV